MQPQQQPEPESQVRAIEWQGDCLRLLDQRLLPGEESYIECRTAAEVAEAIRAMAVQGAPAIGIAAAYAVALSAMRLGQADNWAHSLKADFTLLGSTRPTAMNLSWALRMMQESLQRVPPGNDVPAALVRAAVSIHESDLEANRTMGKLGMQLIRRHHKTRQNLLTHCNAGALAASGYGTALGVIRAAHDAGLVETVFIDETRPWLQGARLTAWELARDGIPATLNVDAAAGHLMKTKDITWVIVGADRIAANGDVINEIGTYSLSILAMHHGLRFMVVAPSSSIDLALEVGDDAELEEGDGDDVLINGNRRLDAGVPACNPVFDVTPADLIDAIVTEKGVIERPDARKIADLMSQRRLH